MYERAQYPHDQRAWVRAADARIPELAKEAARHQQEAARMYQYIELCRDIGLPVKNYSFYLYREASADARRALFQLLHYQGMRNANLPEG